jgi:hypothetical protein
MIPFKSKIPAAVWLLALPPVLAAGFSFFLPYGASLQSAFAFAFGGGAGRITVWENTALFGITLFTLKQAFLSVLV